MTESVKKHLAAKRREKEREAVRQWVKDDLTQMITKAHKEAFLNVLRKGLDK